MRRVSAAILVLFASFDYKDFFFVHCLTTTRAVSVLLPTMTHGWDGASAQAMRLLQTLNNTNATFAGVDLQRRAVAAIWKFVVYVYVARGRPAIDHDLVDRVRLMEFDNPQET